MKLRPLADRVLVKRIPQTEVTKGGIVIPEKHRELEVFADVVAVGPGKVLENGTLRPCSVKPGDRIVFGKYAGNDVRPRLDDEDGEHLIMLRDDEVLAVVEHAT